ncbi:MAG: hypothetical protein KDA57_07895 [Planctomycetales bacterium]|nr:hypothetical protein [Planctomycetales bacterium]
MKYSLAGLAVTVVFLAPQCALRAETAGDLVPGTGTWIEYVGDDFEDTSWGFIHNLPKSSREQDQRLRSPTGRSTNDRWIEGPERGHPDHMKVVPTPPGGLPGSKHALLIRTLNSGIPGYNSYDVQQDDLISNTISRLGMTISASDMPSAVARVYLPPADEWEDRSGPHFGFRISAAATVTKSTPGGFFGSRSSTELEPYWPGIWVHFRSKTDRRVEEDSAFLTIRGNRNGQDVRMKEIPAEDFGWWTFGMSVTPNGMVHYYAKKGVEELTAADHLTSQFPYSFSAQQFRTFFFNACNKNDGKTWSTPFVIDDPKLYVVNSSRVAANVQRKMEREARRDAQRNAKKQSSGKNRG